MTRLFKKYDALFLPGTRSIACFALQPCWNTPQHRQTEISQLLPTCVGAPYLGRGEVCTGCLMWVCLCYYTSPAETSPLISLYYLSLAIGVDGQIRDVAYVRSHDCNTAALITSQKRYHHCTGPSTFSSRVFENMAPAATYIAVSSVYRIIFLNTEYRKKDLEETPPIGVGRGSQDGDGCESESHYDTWKHFTDKPGVR